MNSKEKLVFGIIGDNELENPLLKIASKKKINDINIDVRFLNKKEDILKCDLLLIPDSENDNLKSILKATKNNPVLTIGYGKNYAEKGVCINLIDLKGKIGFESQ
jgi:hypothetical protein